MPRDVSGLERSRQGRNIGQRDKESQRRAAIPRFRLQGTVSWELDAARFATAPRVYARTPPSPAYSSEKPYDFDYIDLNYRRAQHRILESATADAAPSDGRAA